MASNTAGRLKPSKGSVMVPALAISSPSPVPPRIENHAMVSKGAITDIKMIISRALRPRLIRAMKMAIMGP